MAEKFPSQTQDKFTVRFPDGLRDAVAERAKRNGRSMNSEIIDMLSNSLHVSSVEEQNIEHALSQLSREAVEKMSADRVGEIKAVLLSTAKGVSLELSKQNEYLHRVMDILILMEDIKSN